MTTPDSPAELLCIGETMALVTPVSADRLRSSQLFHLDAGGAESNVAAHVASLGHKSAWFSRLGDDELGRRVADTVSSRGVDVSSVIFDPEFPTGVYFKDPGHGVLYYRAGSAASTLSTQDALRLPLTQNLLVHLSGITAALSATASQFLTELFAHARREGARISFDVNYRPALWEPHAAGKTLHRLASQADVVFVGRDEAETLWGSVEPEAIRKLFPDCPSLVVKDGAIGATEFSGSRVTFEPAEVVDVVEPVGAGDAFAGGYLAALISGADTNARLRAGHRRAAMTLQTTTDYIDETGFAQ